MTILFDGDRPEQFANTALKGSVNYYIDDQGLRVIGAEAEFRIKGGANAQLAVRLLNALDGHASVEELLHSLSDRVRFYFEKLLRSLEDNRMLTTGWVPAIEKQNRAGLLLYLRERTADWIDCLRGICDSPVALYAGQNESLIRSRLQAHGFANIWSPYGGHDAGAEPVFIERDRQGPSLTLERIDELSSGSLILVHVDDWPDGDRPASAPSMPSWSRNCVSGLTLRNVRLVAGTSSAEALRLGESIAPQGSPVMHSALSNSVFAASICYHILEKRVAPFLGMESVDPESHLVSIIRADGTSATRTVSKRRADAPAPEIRQPGIRAQGVAGDGAMTFPAHWFDPDFGRLRWLSSDSAALPLALSRIGIAPHSLGKKHITVEQWGLNQAEADRNAIREAIAELEYPQDEQDMPFRLSPVLVASTERVLSDRLSAWGEAQASFAAKGALMFEAFELSGIKDAHLATLARICYLYTDSLPEAALSRLPSGAAAAHACVGSAKGFWIDADPISALSIAIGDALAELQTGAATARQTEIRAMSFDFRSDDNRSLGPAPRSEGALQIRESRLSGSHYVGRLMRSRPCP